MKITLRDDLDIATYLHVIGPDGRSVGLCVAVDTDTRRAKILVYVEELCAPLRALPGSISTFALDGFEYIEFSYSDLRSVGCPPELLHLLPEGVVNIPEGVVNTDE
jgi:hypothetical protein